MKELLDSLVKQYETLDFIKDDPILFPHKFKKKEDIEISGFISSSFAYGKRELFIPKLNQLFNIMNNEPYNFILNFDKDKCNLNGLNYRFAKEQDIYQLLVILNKLYKKDKSSLGELFYNCFKSENNISDFCKIYSMLIKSCDFFYSELEKNCQNSIKDNLGFFHLIPNARNKGACKRLNMFLRWMVRKTPVDFGIWDFISTSDLLIPLDVHVGNVSRSLNLLKRKSNDYKAVIELTSKLLEYDPSDPVKYDFALFGYGVNSQDKLNLITISK